MSGTIIEAVLGLFIRRCGHPAALARSFRRQRGFTLVEMMVVVAILGIITAIVIPNFLKAKDRATWAVAIANLQAVKSSLAFYNANTPDDTYPDATAVSYQELTALLPTANLPLGPREAGWQSVPVSYIPSADRHGYTVNIQVDIRNPVAVVLTPAILSPREFPN